jgi:hypothetical protein
MMLDVEFVFLIPKAALTAFYIGRAAQRGTRATPSEPSPQWSSPLVCLLRNASERRTRFDPDAIRRDSTDRLQPPLRAG